MAKIGEKMKKICPAVLGIVVLCGLINYNIVSDKVFAAYAYSWLVNNGESLKFEESENPDEEIVYKNEDGSAIWRRTAPFEDGGTLILNNYNGGKLKLACFGTRLDHTFKIELVGENKISAEGDVAIASDSPVEITGSGSLEVTANKLLSYENMDGYNQGDLNVKINLTATEPALDSETNSTTTEPALDSETNSTIVENVDNTNSSTLQKDEKETEDAIDWRLLAIIFASISVLEMIVIIILACRKTKNDAKQDPGMPVADVNMENQTQN